MAIPALGTGLIISPPPAYAAVPRFVARTLGAQAKFALWFNNFDGESQEDAGVRTSINAVTGALIQAEDRVWVGNLPVFNTDYATFRNDTPLRCRIMLSEEGSVFVLTRTKDTGIVDGATRAFICGTYGSQAERGLSFEFSNWATGQIRAFSFGLTNPTTPVTITDASGVADLDKWRLLYVGWDADEIEIADLTGSMGTDPAPLPLTDGHNPGTRPWTFGGRETIGGNYNGDIEKDIAFVMGFNRRPTAPQRTTLQLQCEAVVAETDLVLLDTAP